MNMIRKNGGFTLVELIVVIAILAILAGVAVPAYSGYINSANEAADTTALAAVKTAAMAACATEGEVDRIDVTSETSISIYVGDTTTPDHTLTYTDADGWKDSSTTSPITTDFNAFMNGEKVELSYYASAVWYAAADSTNNIEAGWTGTEADD